jgi:fermentation-respiration switch protein FrsA (DUF1100 family)
MNKNVKNLLACGGAVAACAAVAAMASDLITRKLMKLAMVRAEPKKYNKTRAKVSGSKKISETKLLALEYGEKLAQKPCEEVFTESFDGTVLAGHWYPCENASRVIVAMHGWRSSWTKDFGAISEFWHENGCSVLFAEQRGQNNSGGEYMGFGIIERYDCREWARWAQEKTDGLPIYLAGNSMGAATVMMASGLDLPERVVGIMADCGYTSAHDIWQSVVQNRFHIPYGICKREAERICFKRINESAKAVTCPAALKNCKVPVLFVHGTGDTFVPIEMTYTNYMSCASPKKRLLIVPGAEHSMSYLVDSRAYEEAVKLFWADCEKSV